MLVCTNHNADAGGRMRDRLAFAALFCRKARNSANRGALNAELELFVLGLRAEMNSADPLHRAQRRARSIDHSLQRGSTACSERTRLRPPRQYLATSAPVPRSFD